MAKQEKQMFYIIEGTVLEIERNESNEYTFKIEGTESYSLRKCEKGVDVKYNVLCLNDTHDSDDKKPRNAIIVSTDDKFNVSKDDILLLTTALSADKILRFVFEEVQEAKAKTDVITDVLDKKLKIVSLSLLAN